MPDDNTPEGGKADDKGGQEFKAITSQDDLNRIITTRIERERARFADYDEVKTKAAEFDKAAEASKSEIQKAVERADAAESRAATFEAKEQRVTWAAEITKDSAVPAAALRGSTREELLEHFELLKPLVTKPTQSRMASPAGRPSHEGGEKGRAAAAVRMLRGGNP